ncbi:hypothetical protein MMC12_004919 [Toensbergia leucococca]|nr:hypothetical protein [Toensbergia leucococca]
MPPLRSVSLGDLPPPYHAGALMPNESSEDPKEVATGRYRSMTDPLEFVTALANPETRTTEALFAIAKNAQEAVKAWQDEFIELDKNLPKKDPKYKSMGDPRKPEDAEEYDEKLDCGLNDRPYRAKRKIEPYRPSAKTELKSRIVGGRELRVKNPRKKTSLDVDDEGAKPARGKGLRTRKATKKFEGESDPATSRATSAKGKGKQVPVSKETLGKRKRGDTDETTAIEDQAPKRKGRPPKKTVGPSFPGLKSGGSQEVEAGPSTTPSQVPSIKVSRPASRAATRTASRVMSESAIGATEGSMGYDSSQPPSRPASTSLPAKRKRTLKDEETPDAVVEPPKKKGRPTKKVVSHSFPGLNVAASVEVEPPKKKGRPAKKVVSPSFPGLKIAGSAEVETEPSQVVSSATSVAPTNKRKRPVKVEEEPPNIIELGPRKRVRSAKASTETLDDEELRPKKKGRVAKLTGEETKGTEKQGPKVKGVLNKMSEEKPRANMKKSRAVKKTTPAFFPHLNPVRDSFDPLFGAEGFDKVPYLATEEELDEALKDAITDELETNELDTDETPVAQVSAPAAAPKNKGGRPRKKVTEAKTTTTTAATSQERDADGKNPVRREAMKAVWAKRKAEGRSGRHGGAPLAKGAKGRPGRPKRAAAGKAGPSNVTATEDEEGDEDDAAVEGEEDVEGDDVGVGGEEDGEEDGGEEED